MECRLERGRRDWAAQSATAGQRARKATRRRPALYAASDKKQSVSTARLFTSTAHTRI
jgi:hypothetical protein